MIAAELANLRDGLLRWGGVSAALPAEPGYPPVNIYQGEGVLVLEAEIPGVKAEDLEISLKGDLLVIRGKNSSSLPPEAKWLRQERMAGSFERKIRLPFAGLAESEAVVKNGCLQLVFPLPAEALPRKISVKNLV